MQEKQIVIAGTLPMTRERVIRLVSISNSFVSQVLLEKPGVTINGKSMLGLLSLSDSMGRAFRLTVNGPDEAAALPCIARLLEAEEDAAPEK